MGDKDKDKDKDKDEEDDEDETGKKKKKKSSSRGNSDDEEEGKGKKKGSTNNSRSALLRRMWRKWTRQKREKPWWQICLIPMQRLLPRSRGLNSLALQLLRPCRAMRRYLKRL